MKTSARLLAGSGRRAIVTERAPIGMLIALLSLLLVNSASHAQSPEVQFSRAIEDNSFLIEEAYNQEAGVVQHISTALVVGSPSAEIEYGFTQEWPLASHRHQLSYSVPVAMMSPSHGRGIGNLLINYRYQLAGGASWAAIAPRLSVILPTSVEGFQQHLGTAGWQVNLPFSRRWSNVWVAHMNIGATYLPEVHHPSADAREAKVALSSFTAGASTVWLAGEHSNFLFEVLAAGGAAFNDRDEIEHTTSYIINPGYRHAFDVGAVQIVPGISVPVVLSPGSVSAGFLFYLSFEHPF